MIISARVFDIRPAADPAAAHVLDHFHENALGVAHFLHSHGAGLPQQMRFAAIESGSSLALKSS